METEKEKLKFKIGRYDHYYDSVNNKCNVFLALGIFIFGALAGFYPTLTKIVDCGVFMHTLMIIMMMLSICTMITVLMASTPYLTSETNSLIYFSSVANMGGSEFSRRSSVETLDEELTDLRNQTFELAVGLQGKFSKLRLASFLFIIQFLLFIPWIISIINNLKESAL